MNLNFISIINCMVHFCSSLKIIFPCSSLHLPLPPPSSSSTPSPFPTRTSTSTPNPINPINTSHTSHPAGNHDLREEVV